MSIWYRWIGLAIWLFSPVLLAAQPVPAPARFQVPVAPTVTFQRIPGFEDAFWGEHDGAPAAIQAMAQSGDGYLWIGTNHGLFRFDGVAFQQFLSAKEQLPAAGVTTLAAAADGSLWVGFSDGRISHLQNDNVRTFSPRNAHAAEVSSIAIVPGGDIWAVLDHRIFRLHDGLWEDRPLDPGPCDTEAEALLPQPEGGIWIRTKTRVCLYRDHEMREVDLGPKITWLTGLAPTQPGVLWATDYFGTLVHLVAGGHDFHSDQRSFMDLHPNGFLIDRNHGLWTIDARHGVCRFLLSDATSRRLYPTDGACMEDAAQPRIRRTFVSIEDHEGDIWVATSSGLVRFRPNRFTPSPIGTPGGAALISDPHGTLWVGTRDAPLASVADGVIRSYGPRRTIRTLYSTPDGTIWFTDEHGLWRFRAGHLTYVAGLPVNDGQAFQCLAVDRQGKVLVGFARAGLFQLSGARWRPLHRDFVPDAMVFTMYVDHAGLIWMGFDNGRVAVWDGGSGREIMSPNLHSLARILAIQEGPQGLWLAGERGLALLHDGRTTVFHTAEPGLLVGISGIAVDSHQDVWLNGASGLIRLSAEAIRQAIEGASRTLKVQEVLDRSDGIIGIPSHLTPLQSITLAGERLWFSTSRLLGSVDLSRRFSPLTAPQMTEVALDADGRTVKFEPAKGFRVPAGTRVLNVSYGAISLAHPEKLIFRYRLEPITGNGEVTTQQRVASFIGLGAGRYTFQVTGCTENDTCNPSGASAVIIVLPHMYLRPWFLGICGLTLVAAWYFFYRWRVQQACTLAAAHVHAQLAERERIARELHDTLLQGIQGLTLQFFAVATSLDADDPNRIRLERALSNADRAIAEARDQVQNLRAGDEWPSNIVEALERLLAVSSLPGVDNLILEVTGDAVALRPEVHEEVLSIGIEALRNAMQHSGADSIRVLIAFRPLRFELAVLDDGLGMSPEMLQNGRPGHWGLKGMKERAGHIQARLTIVSRPGQGTELRLSIPAAVAFPHPSLYLLRILLRWPSPRASGVPRQ